MGGAMCKLFKQRSFRVMYFGLDAAGKTTLLYRMKLGLVVPTIPTIGVNVETVEHKGVELVTWDVSARDKGRVLYRHYLPNTDAFFFIVDSTDRERLNEAAEEFFSIIYPYVEETNTPVAVLANKQDISGAMTAEEVKKGIWSKGKINTSMEVFPTVGTTLEGVEVALDWLTHQIALKLGKESLQTWTQSVYYAVYHPAEFMKTSFHSFTGLFAVRQPKDQGDGHNDELIVVN